MMFAMRSRSSKRAARRWRRRSSAAARFRSPPKLAIAGGAAWIALVLLLVLPFIPGPVIAALAAVIGGTVLLGSNATTWNQADADLRQTEAMRADLIGRMDLRLIGEQRRTLH